MAVDVRRVVVTGLGVITPLGNDPETLFGRLMEGTRDTLAEQHRMTPWWQRAGYRVHRGGCWLPWRRLGSLSATFYKADALGLVKSVF